MRPEEDRRQNTEGRRFSFCAGSGSASIFCLLSSVFCLLLLTGCGGAPAARTSARPAAAKRAHERPAEAAAREAELVRRAELKQLHEELKAARALELAAEEELAAERLPAAITRLEAALAAWRLIRAKRPDEPKLAWIEGHLPILARRLDETRARQADEVARWHRELPRREQLDYPVLPP